MRALSITLLAILAGTTGCRRGQHYQLTGQVLAVNQTRQEITIKHADIPGFMPGMTMPFRVKDAGLLNGRVPGDLVSATLEVHPTDAYLTSIVATGHATPIEPLPADGITNPLEPGTTVADADFIDDSGTKRRFSEWRGRTLAVTFIYTRCPLPDFCPRMNRNFAAVQHGILADRQLRDRVHLLSVSFDPAVDTPAVLAKHARQAGANPDVWSFLTGERDAIGRFASQFGVSTIREDGSTEIVHNLRTALISSDGRLVKVFTGTDWTPDELLASLRSGG
jgi:protein SCO1/2